MLCRRNTEVWGAGIISENSLLKEKPSKVYAVRGPLTRQRLIKEGIDCPEIYGDPALLIPYYYRPKVTKSINTVLSLMCLILMNLKKCK